MPDAVASRAVMAAAVRNIVFEWGVRGRLVENEKNNRQCERGREKKKEEKKWGRGGSHKGVWTGALHACESLTAGKHRARA